MPILHAIILGIVQGLTEFLPVSSSGHLAVVPWLFGWEQLEEGLKQDFDVALHIGTFVGAVAYFWRDIWGIVTVKARHRLGGLLLLATIPAALVGVVVEDVVAGLNVPLTASMLVIFGFVLLWADRREATRAAESGEQPFGPRDAVIMGVAQSVALLPGVSRSGVTITAGRVLGFDRESAARLSFLMSLPVIGGAAAYKGLQIVGDGGLPSDLVAPFVFGIVASGITGAIAVAGLLKLIKTATFMPFVVYRVLAAILILGVYFVR